MDKASLKKAVRPRKDWFCTLNKLFDASVEVNKKSTGAKQKKMGKVSVSKKEYDILKYYINRDIVGFGPIEPLILDPYIEDIHLIGTSRVRVSHKAFQYGLETIYASTMM